MGLFEVILLLLIAMKLGMSEKDANLFIAVYIAWRILEANLEVMKNDPQSQKILVMDNNGEKKRK